jgi:hypothetical protein
MFNILESSILYDVTLVRTILTHKNVGITSAIAYYVLIAVLLSASHVPVYTQQKYTKAYTNSVT